MAASLHSKKGPKFRPSGCGTSPSRSCVRSFGSNNIVFSSDRMVKGWGPGTLLGFHLPSWQRPHRSCPTACDGVAVTAGHEPPRLDWDELQLAHDRRQAPRVLGGVAGSDHVEEGDRAHGVHAL